MIPAAAAGMAAGYAIAIPVGAIAAYLVTLGARTAWRTAAAGALGAATADGVYAALAVFAGALVATSIAAVETPLRWVSAIVLLVVAVRMVQSAFAAGPAPAGPRPPPVRVTARRAFATVFGLTLVNPATVIYFAAVVAGSSVAASAGAGDRMAFVAGALVASASWQLLLVSAGSTLSRFLTADHTRRATGMIGGAMIAVLAVRSVL